MSRAQQGFAYFLRVLSENFPRYDGYSCDWLDNLDNYKTPRDVDELIATLKEIVDDCDDAHLTLSYDWMEPSDMWFYKNQPTDLWYERGCDGLVMHIQIYSFSFEDVDDIINELNVVSQDVPVHVHIDHNPGGMTRIAARYIRALFHRDLNGNVTPHPKKCRDVFLDIDECFSASLCLLDAARLAASSHMVRVRAYGTSGRDTVAANVRVFEFHGITLRVPTRPNYYGTRTGARRGRMNWYEGDPVTHELVLRCPDHEWCEFCPMIGGFVRPEVLYGDPE